MIRRFMGALALAAAMVGGVQAGPVDYIYNYSGATGYESGLWTGYLGRPGVSYKVYGGLNLTGALLGTLAENFGVIELSAFTLGSGYADFIDGTFSVLWHADDIDVVQPYGVPVVNQDNVTLLLNSSSQVDYQGGFSVGQNCLATPALCTTAPPPGPTPSPSPSGSNIPEPTSLALVALAGLLAGGMSRRRGRQGGAHG